MDKSRKLESAHLYFGSKGSSFTSEVIIFHPLKRKRANQVLNSCRFLLTFFCFPWRVRYCMPVTFISFPVPLFKFHPHVAGLYEPLPQLRGPGITLQSTGTCLSYVRYSQKILRQIKRRARNRIFRNGRLGDCSVGICTRPTCCSTCVRSRWICSEMCRSTRRITSALTRYLNQKRKIAS